MTTFAQTAYEEAGHVVIGVRLGCPIGEKGVVVEAPKQGSAHVVAEGLNAIAVALAGPLAGVKSVGVEPAPDELLLDYCDVKRARQIALELGSEEPEQLLLSLQHLVVSMLRNPQVWAQVKRVAEALNAGQRLSAEQVAELMRQ